MFLLLYVLIALKVKQWEVITILGFRTETPQGYLTNPKYYNLTRTICFLVAVIAVIFSPYRYSGTVGFPILGLLWFIVNNAGINRGIKEYRRVMKETCAYYEGNPSAGRDDFYEHAKKSFDLNDEDIYQMYKKRATLDNELQHIFRKSE